MGPQEDENDVAPWDDGSAADSNDDDPVLDAADVFQLDAGVSLAAYRVAHPEPRVALHPELPPTGHPARRWGSPTPHLHPHTIQGALAASFWCPTTLQYALLAHAAPEHGHALLAAHPAASATTAAAIAAIDVIVSAPHFGPLKVVFLAPTVDIAEKASSICSELSGAIPTPIKNAVIGMQTTEDDLGLAHVLYGTPTSAQRVIDAGTADVSQVELLVVDNVSDGLAPLAMQVKGRLPEDVRIIVLTQILSDEILSFTRQSGRTWTVLELSKQPDLAPCDEVLLEDAQKAKQDGNDLYKLGDWVEAIGKYSHALRCDMADDDTKAVYYCNRAASRLKVLDWKGAERDCSLALQLKKNYSKALLRRKVARERQLDYAGATKDAKYLEKIGEGTLTEVARLEDLRKEKAQKDTEDAMEKLKDLGNSLLGNFGLSLNNFKMDKDSGSGGYNIRFEQ